MAAHVRFGADGGDWFLASVGPVTADVPVFSVPQNHHVLRPMTHAHAAAAAWRLWDELAITASLTNSTPWLGVDCVWVGCRGPALVLSLSTLRSTMVLSIGSMGGRYPAVLGDLLAGTDVAKCCTDLPSVNRALSDAGLHLQRSRDSRDLARLVLPVPVPLLATLSQVCMAVLHSSVPRGQALRFLDWGGLLTTQQVDFMVLQSFASLKMVREVCFRIG
ncbi:hypothetical protein I4F81_007344 [Pyropia yezoensis]|uniref:Uncharacterized protein n=1 Tax=Pyropia yezoensis TaxID=2788 RepID=A0ACC3C3R3_PYRYE|nr:hypothetical protein I4F81_007344 [Neopyropia yezoensis]